MNTHILLADFPPLIWVLAYANLTRKTNICDHSWVILVSFYISNAHIYYCINKIIKLQTEIYVKVNSVITN